MKMTSLNLQLTKPADGTFVYALGLPGSVGGNHVLRQHPIAEVDQKSFAGQQFELTAGIVADFMADQAAIVQDLDLSPMGQLKKLEPMVINAIGVVAATKSRLDKERARIQKQYDAMIAVPELAPSNAAEATRDMEVRTWWREQPLAVKKDAIDKMATLDDEAYRRMEIALLRSPVVVADPLLQAVKATWIAAKRTENVSLALNIDAGLATVEWALRGVSQLGAILLTSIGTGHWPRHRVLSVLAASPNPDAVAGHGAFGFTDREMADEKRRQAAIAGRAVA